MKKKVNGFWKETQIGSGLTKKASQCNCEWASQILRQRHSMIYTWLVQNYPFWISFFSNPTTKDYNILHWMQMRSNKRNYKWLLWKPCKKKRHTIQGSKRILQAPFKSFDRSENLSTIKTDNNCVGDTKRYFFRLLYSRIEELFSRIEELYSKIEELNSKIVFMKIYNSNWFIHCRYDCDGDY